MSFTVSPVAQREYRVLGGMKPAGAETEARAALAAAASQRMTEPLQPGDPDEAEQGAPEPVPDPPDTDPIPEEEKP